MALTNGTPPRAPAAAGEPGAGAKGSGWEDAHPEAMASMDADYLARLVLERVRFRPTLHRKVGDLFRSRFGAKVKAVLVKVPLLGVLLASWGIVTELNEMAKEYLARVKAQREGKEPAAAQTVEGGIVKTEAPAAPGEAEQSNP